MNCQECYQDINKNFCSNCGAKIKNLSSDELKEEIKKIFLNKEYIGFESHYENKILKQDHISLPNINEIIAKDNQILFIKNQHNININFIYNNNHPTDLNSYSSIKNKIKFCKNKIKFLQNLYENENDKTMKQNIFKEIQKYKNETNEHKKKYQSILKYSDQFIECIEKLSNILRTTNDIYIIEILHLEYKLLNYDKNTYVIKLTTIVKDIKISLKTDDKKFKYYKYIDNFIKPFGDKFYIISPKYFLRSELDSPKKFDISGCHDFSFIRNKIYKGPYEINYDEIKKICENYRQKLDRFTRIIDEEIKPISYFV